MIGLYQNMQKCHWKKSSSIKSKKTQKTEANIITSVEILKTQPLEIKNNTSMLIITSFAQHFREALARAIKQEKDKNKGITIEREGMQPPLFTDCIITYL